MSTVNIYEGKKIMVAVPTGEFGRHAAFWDYYNMLEKPEGCICSLAHGQSPAASRNQMIEAALEHDCTHILFLDDDMVFPKDTLSRLLQHDKDIVAGHYLMRQYPHQGLVFDYAEPDGQCHWHEVADNTTGLIKVVATGLGCCLFKTKVFEELEKPWIRLGEIQKDGWCDDIGLFNRIRQVGYEIFLDLDLHIGHIGSMVVTPSRQNNQWHVQISTFGTDAVAFPMIRRQNNGLSSSAK